MVRVKSWDPRGARWRRRLFVPLLNNGAGYWYLTSLAPRIDATLTPATKAWLSSVPLSPLLLLHHTGAKTGRQRTTPLMYFSRGDDVVLMASNYGRDRHPAWLYNVIAHPDVELEFRGRRGRYRARVAEGAEHDELWRQAKDFIANYRNYEQRAAGKRNIEVVVCSPSD